jgi:predicted amidohydrolase YtcJ
MAHGLRPSPHSDHPVSPTGGLQVASLADVILLADAFREVDPDGIADIEVHSTWVAGQNPVSRR